LNADQHPSNSRVGHATQSTPFNQIGKISTSLRWRIVLTVYLLAVAIGFGIYFRGIPTPTQPGAAVPSQQQPSIADTEPITPLPLVMALNPEKVELGRRLFHDTKLSGDGTVSCASCHSLSSAGVDRLPHSRGIGGQEGPINAPTVFNSGLSFRQFWDGRAESLEDQVDGPLQNPLEMGGTWPKAIAALESDASYQTAFTTLYPDGVAPKNVRDAIATFERSLITPNSRFDRYLRGDQTALNETEREGYRLFKRIGCVSCHQGMGIGGNVYQKLGIMEDYFAQRGQVNTTDFGRFNVTQREEDRFFFKVPSLRNVALTAPYLHDGRAATLDEVVQIMARYQLGVRLEVREEAAVVAFLRSLTGEYQGQALQ
jgi:cytochrome c peroxidase